MDKQTTWRRIALAAGILVVLAYFWRFNRPALYGGFNVDDPMNMWGYWSRGPAKLIQGVILFFTPYYRPMGGVFYSVLYHFFGFTPFPYHVALVALALLNTFLAWRCARLLTGSALIGGFCALIVAYHPQMAHLVYLPSFVYDLLCFTFYFLSLGYYLSIRSRGASLTRKQVVVFLLLYVGALESKEMAVTLPVIVLLYEALWHKLRLSNALPGLLAGLLTAVYIVGKSIGPEALTNMEAYRPVLSWQLFIHESTKYLNTIFYQPIEGFFQPARTVLLWLALLALAAALRHRQLLWSVAFILIAPLPIAFLPGRGGPLLYIPLFGWAMIVATLFAGLVRPVPQRFQPLRAAIVVAGVVLLWRNTDYYARAVPAWMAGAAEVSTTISQQLRTVQPRIEPGSRVLFLNDLSDSYDTMFIAKLVYHDRSIDVQLQHKANLSPEEIAKMDYIFEFVDKKLKRVKP